MAVKRSVPSEAEYEEMMKRFKEREALRMELYGAALGTLGAGAAAAGGGKKLRRHMSTRQMLGYMTQLLKMMAKGAKKGGSYLWDVIKSAGGWVVAGAQTLGLLKFGQMELKQSEALTQYGQTQLQVQQMISESIKRSHELKAQELALRERELMLKQAQMMQQTQRLSTYRERRQQAYRTAKTVDPRIKAALEAQVAEAKARSAAMWQDWERARQAAREASLAALKASLEAAVEQGKILGENWLDAQKKARDAALAAWKTQLQAYLKNLEAAHEQAKIMRKAEAEMRVAITKEMARMRREVAVERLKGLIEMDLEREKTLRNLQETARLLNVQQRKLVGDLLETVKEMIKKGEDYREPLRLVIDMLTNPEKYKERLQVREVKVRRW